MPWAAAHWAAYEAQLSLQNQTAPHLPEEGPAGRHRASGLHAQDFGCAAPLTLAQLIFPPASAKGHLPPVNGLQA